MMNSMTNTINSDYGLFEHGDVNIAVHYKILEILDDLFIKEDQNVALFPVLREGDAIVHRIGIPESKEPLVVVSVITDIFTKEVSSFWIQSEKKFTHWLRPTLEDAFDMLKTIEKFYYFELGDHRP
jgi:hypothetical protein